MNDVIPVHQWTHTGGRVRILKCVDKDGVSFGGFQWPSSGPVRPDYCSMDGTCDSGGLFGWAWGVGVGGGKEPDYLGRWIVFSAPPKQVVDLGDKVKVASTSPELVDAVVEFCGTWWDAVATILDGRVAWIEHASSGAASATGWSGAASATGWRGAASATGERGAASATGERGAASATGEDSFIEVGSESIACVSAQTWRWKVMPGAVVACRWRDGSTWPCRLLMADNEGLVPGKIYTVVCGEIQGD